VGVPAGDQRFCASCGLNLGNQQRLATRAEWSESARAIEGGSEPEQASLSSRESADATSGPSAGASRPNIDRGRVVVDVPRRWAAQYPYRFWPAAAAIVAVIMIVIVIATSGGGQELNAGAVQTSLQGDQAGNNVTWNCEYGGLQGQFVNSSALNCVANYPAAPQGAGPLFFIAARGGNCFTATLWSSTNNIQDANGDNIPHVINDCS
jgi:hypothetical protein